MNVTILGKDLTATEAIKDYVDKKMDRIQNILEKILMYQLHLEQKEMNK